MNQADDSVFLFRAAESLPGADDAEHAPCQRSRGKVQSQREI
jgi:hypothetical protein